MTEIQERSLPPFPSQPFREIGATGLYLSGLLPETASSPIEPNPPRRPSEPPPSPGRPMPDNTPTPDRPGRQPDTNPR